MRLVLAAGPSRYQWRDGDDDDDDNGDDDDDDYYYGYGYGDADGDDDVVNADAYEDSANNDDNE